MSKKTTTTLSAGQSHAEWRDAFGCAMAAEGFVRATQKVYARALDRFAVALKDRSPAEATVQDARGYLARLKRTGRSQCIRSQASAALRFFFTRVRHLKWEPVSPLRERMIEDMELRGFSARTQQSYVRSVLALARHYNRAPDQISDEEIRAYFVHLTCKRKLARPTITIALCGISCHRQIRLRRKVLLPEHAEARLVADRGPGAQAPEEAPGMPRRSPQGEGGWCSPARRSSRSSPASRSCAIARA